jgi:hypothetical protein
MLHAEGEFGGVMGRSSQIMSLMLACGLAACALAGCGSVPWTEHNPKLLPGGKVDGKPYTLSEVLNRPEDSEFIILFAFSGGGKRSASFGYGALKAADGIEIEGRSTLADEIDVVSGVSGGSFTASAFALYGDKLFQGALVDPGGVAHPSYEDFLDSNTNASILEIYLEPWRWQWMVNPHVGTNDEMEAAYENALFGSTTFRDLASRGRPYLVVQATDLDAQQPFTFTQTDFDLICSDISSVKISRAVAASNGFPVLFSPIGLQMHSYPQSLVGDGTPDPKGPCPDLPWRRAGTSGPFTRQTLLAQRAELYAPPGMKKGDAYVHLADGGLSDNLALRGVASIWTRLGMESTNAACANVAPSAPGDDPCARLGKLHLANVRQILVVSVDGEAEPDRNNEIDVPVLGGLSRIADATLNSVIDSANLSTLPLAAEATQDFRRAVGTLKCRAHGLEEAICTNPPDMYVPDAVFAHVSLSEWARQNPAQAQDIANSPTGLSLPRGDAAKLVEAGKSAFLSNPDINCFLRNAGVTPYGAVSSHCPAKKSP